MRELTVVLNEAFQKAKSSRGFPCTFGLALERVLEHAGLTGAVVLERRPCGECGGLGTIPNPESMEMDGGEPDAATLEFERCPRCHGTRFEPGHAGIIDRDTLEALARALFEVCGHLERDFTSWDEMGEEVRDLWRVRAVMTMQRAFPPSVKLVTTGNGGPAE